MGVQPADATVLLAVLLVIGLGPRRLRRLARRVVAHVDRVWAASRPAAATGRPIELIAGDAHRLGRRFRCVPAGVSFARFEARRRAYDEVLTEACATLGVEHLLGVLPPGPELDAERRRVEVALDRAGLGLA